LYLQAVFATAVVISYCCCRKRLNFGKSDMSQAQTVATATVGADVGVATGGGIAVQARAGRT